MSALTEPNAGATRNPEHEGTRSGDGPSAATPRDAGRVVDRPVSARIDEDLHKTVMRIAFARFDAGMDECTPADVIRAALKEYLDTRISDPALPTRVKAAQARQQAVLAAVDPSINPAPDDETPPPAPVPLRGNKERPVTLRIDDRTHDLLTAFALLDQTGMADQLRLAVAHYVNGLSQDPEFNTKVEQVRAAQADLLAAFR